DVGDEDLHPVVSPIGELPGDQVSASGRRLPGDGPTVVTGLILPEAVHLLAPSPTGRAVSLAGARQHGWNHGSVDAWVDNGRVCAVDLSALQEQPKRKRCLERPTAETAPTAAWEHASIHIGGTFTRWYVYET